MSLQKRLGVLLRDRRLELDMKANQVAELSGLSKSAVSHIENGNRGVSIESLEAICKTLDIKVSTVVMRAEKK